MSDKVSEDKVKIGGWLVVVGIFLWLGVITDSLSILFGLIATGMHLQTTSGLLVRGLINIVMLLPMLVMFHRRKAALVWWAVIYGVYAIAYECIIQYRHVIAHYHTFLGGLFAVVLEALFMTGVVMYFFTSKRVKRTFVR